MSKPLISLENIDTMLTSAPQLTPKSKKALKRLGIIESELVHHPLSEFMTKGMDEETAKQRFNFAEHKRLERLKWAKEEYSKITEFDMKSKQERSNQGVSNYSGDMWFR